MLNNITLGLNAAIVKIDIVINKDAYLWRPIEAMNVMGDALFANIAWPFSNVQLCKEAGPSVSKGTFPLFANGAVPSKDSSSKASLHKSVANSSNTNSSCKKKCFLLDCFGSGKNVAEGKVLPNNPEEKVHFVPLGPNANKVWVELCKIDDARIWRPTSKFQTIADALGSTLACPNDKIVFV